MTQPNVNRMVSGKNNVSMEVLNGLGKTYEQVNHHWLLTGRGEMFLEGLIDINSETNENSIPNNVKERLSEVERLAEQLGSTLSELLKSLKRK